MSPPAQLTNLQQELLQAFSWSLSEGELLEVRRYLLRRFAEKITADVDAVLKSRGITPEESDNWANGHERALLARSYRGFP